MGRPKITEERFTLPGLRAARERAGLSLRELCVRMRKAEKGGGLTSAEILEACGHAPSLWRTERGERTVGKAERQKLARGLRVTVAVLDRAPRRKVPA